MWERPTLTLLVIVAGADAFAEVGGMPDLVGDGCKRCLDLTRNISWWNNPILTYFATRACWRSYEESIVFFRAIPAHVSREHLACPLTHFAGYCSKTFEAHRYYIYILYILMHMFV